MVLLGWLLTRLKPHWEAFAGFAAATWAWLSWNQHQRTSRIDQAADAVHQQVQRLIAEQGAAAAHLKVQQTYLAELNSLNAEEAAHAATLMHDPAAMARYIVQLTGSAQFPGHPVPPPDVPPK